MTDARHSFFLGREGSFTCKNNSPHNLPDKKFMGTFGPAVLNINRKISITQQTDVENREIHHSTKKCHLMIHHNILISKILKVIEMREKY